MIEEIIIEETCRKCGSPEKIWNERRGRYDCMQCGKKWIKIQRTGYNGEGKTLKWWKVFKTINKFFKGEL